MRKVRMNVTGLVQGVGFRYTTKMLADRLNVKGSVWNEADGSVGIKATGEESAVNEFIAGIKASPTPAGHVDYINIIDDPNLKEHATFEVVFSGY